MIAKVAILCAVFAAAHSSGFLTAPIVSTGISSTSRQQDSIGNYAFNYGIADGLGATNTRAEIGDAFGNKKGSYSLTDIDGRARRVDYVADAAGFRAAVNTNEPGTALSAPAAAAVVSPYAGPVAPVAAAPVVAAPVVAAAPLAAPAPIVPIAHAVSSYSTFIGHAAPAVAPVVAAPAPVVAAAPGVASYSTVIGHTAPAPIVAAPAPVFAAAPAVSSYSSVIGHAAPAPVVAAPAAVSSYSTVVGHGANIAAPFVGPAAVAPVVASPAVASYNTLVGKGSLFPARTSVAKSIHL